MASDQPQQQQQQQQQKQQSSLQEVGVLRSIFMEEHKMLSVVSWSTLKQSAAAGLQELHVTDVYMTWTAAGYILGEKGDSVRDIVAVTGADVSSRQGSWRHGNTPARWFQVMSIERAEVDRAVSIMKGALQQFNRHVSLKKSFVCIAAKDFASTIDGVVFNFRPPSKNGACTRFVPVCKLPLRACPVLLGSDNPKRQTLKADFSLARMHSYPFQSQVHLPPLPARSTIPFQGSLPGYHPYHVAACGMIGNHSLLPPLPFVQDSYHHFARANLEQEKSKLLHQLAVVNHYEGFLQSQFDPGNSMAYEQKPAVQRFHELRSAALARTASFPVRIQAASSRHRQASKQQQSEAVHPSQQCDKAALEKTPSSPVNLAQDADSETSLTTALNATPTKSTQLNISLNNPSPPCGKTPIPSHDRSMTTDLLAAGAATHLQSLLAALPSSEALSDKRPAAERGASRSVVMPLMARDINVMPKSEENVTDSKKSVRSAQPPFAGKRPLVCATEKNQNTDAATVVVGSLHVPLAPPLEASNLGEIEAN